MSHATFSHSHTISTDSNNIQSALLPRYLGWKQLQNACGVVGVGKVFASPNVKRKGVAKGGVGEVGTAQKIRTALRLGRLNWSAVGWEPKAAVSRCYGLGGSQGGAIGALRRGGVRA